MRILVLSKRQYMGHDLLDDRYGRFWELPLSLACLGNKVVGLCLSYRPKDEGKHEAVVGDSHVTWYARNVKRLLPWASNNYLNTIDSIGKEFKPDLVWACSDAFHAILGKQVSRRLNIPLTIDLYDNFESFPATKIPMVTSLYHQALRFASGISCISAPLSRMIQDITRTEGKITIIENGVPTDLFRPLDKLKSRESLGLPQEGLMFGVGGAISKSRGIEIIFKAFFKISREHPEVHLVLAGPCDKMLTIPQHPKIHYLGMLPQQKMPLLLSSLNVAVIPNKNSEFGRYCFPQKFYECIACMVPIVATKIGVMHEYLKDTPKILYKPDDVDSLVSSLLTQMEKPFFLSLEVPSWANLGKKLDLFLRSCLKS